MTETEGMEALKRTYAEMILNTAKEAAARVMAAELRTRRMEQELNSNKEEAAGMLLRLKQTIDLKTKEAEIMSLNQKRKHDELESQLNEAEGIIVDLRAELHQAEEQLYEMKHKKMLAVIQKEENEEERSIKPKDTCIGYELFPLSPNLGPEFRTVGGPNLTHNSASDVCLGDNNSVLDQIKEPERFRNGCTQRICATETSLVQESSLVGEKMDLSKNSTNTETVKAAESESVLEEKVQQEKNVSISIVRRSLRKRKLKFWGDVMTACGAKGYYQIEKPCQAFPNLPCFRGNVKRCVQYDEDREKNGTEIENINHAEVPKEIVHSEGQPENMELIDVVVKQDELAESFKLSSSSSIECGVERSTASKGSNLGYSNGKRLCKYTLKKKLKRRSMIYDRKWKKKSMI